MRMRSDDKQQGGNKVCRWRRGWVPLMVAAGLQGLPGFAQDSEVLT